MPGRLFVERAARAVSVTLVWTIVAASCQGGEQASPPAPTATAAPVSTATPIDPTPTPLPTPTPVPTPSAIDCISTIAARTALGQLIMTLATPAEIPDAIGLVRAGALGSVGLLGQPTGDELAALASADDGAVMPVLVASDEEGGRVQRLATLLGMSIPSAASLDAQGADAIEQVFVDYGTKLLSAGVDVAFAPVIDVGAGPGIDSRSFSDDPDTVITDARAVIDGYRTAGVIPVIKHFPGHGSASGDTHLGFATTPPIDMLRARDLVPFVELAGPDVWVMVGHLLVPGLTEELPASLSPAAIDGLLRDELGFDGVVITDALGMGAVSQRWTNPEAALLALLAGADIVMAESPVVVVDVLDHLEAAVADGSLPRAVVDDSVARVLLAKGVDACVVAPRLASPP